MRVDFECRACGKPFHQGWGKVRRCPYCGSKKFWITGGWNNILYAALLTAIICAIVLIAAFPYMPMLTVGGFVGMIIGFPMALITLWAKRKPG